MDVKFVIGANSFSPSLLWDFVSMFDFTILFSYAVHMLSVNESANIKLILHIYAIKIKINTILNMQLCSLIKKSYKYNSSYITNITDALL